MKKKEYVVRIVQTADEIGKETTNWAQLIEHLRYAGIVSVHRDDETGICFDIHAPKSCWPESEVWANQNAERIRSVGTNAVKAPAYR